MRSSADATTPDYAKRRRAVLVTNRVATVAEGLVPLLGPILILWACASPAASAAPASPEPHQLSFAVIGGIPSNPREEPVAAAILRAIDASEAILTIDVGNIKGADEACGDGLLEVRKTLLDGAQKPLVLVPGSNDWTLCSSDEAGRFDRTERLNRMRELFFNQNISLGRDPLALVRQSQMRRFHEYSENVRWQVGGVLFIGLNVPGTNNNYRFAAGRNGEFEERVEANKAWLEFGFRYARDHHCGAIVIFFEGDPDFARPLRIPDTRARSRDGFYELKNVLRDQAARFPGQILIAHAGSLAGPLDSPLSDGAGHPLRNVVRMRSFGPPASPNWVEVDVDLDRTPVFRLRQHALSNGETAPPDPAQ